MGEFFGLTVPSTAHREELCFAAASGIRGPQFRPMNCVVQVMASGWLLMPCEVLHP